MVLLSAQNMDVADIAKVAFTKEDHVQDVIHSFSADGFESLYARYRGGRPPKFTLTQRREIKSNRKTAPTGPTLIPGEHRLMRH
jgi:transposase